MSYNLKNGVTVSIRQRTHTCLSLTILVSDKLIHTGQTVPEFLVANPETPDLKCQDFRGHNEKTFNNGHSY